ncbi:hypothetical protein L6164_008797 [Bauhinia variegata]|uniref:Uncharacterized protein n=1 Tax=Bauhinia variegata TaxID=167791 RepID=A0ACB9PNE2_BAUVA|nr:hypothetical protein L6164_008797 [Bauhinia variegata]
MVAQKQALTLLLSLLAFSFILEPSLGAVDEPGIAVYWGQDGREDNLQQTCDSGNFKYVILAFLTVFGCGRTPNWNFAGHCTEPWTPCSSLAPGIQYCQSKNIKVLLSLGGAPGDLSNYSLCSPDDAQNVADYLYQNFLSGQNGPLGSVTLDGIDFDIEGFSNLYYDDLAKALKAYSTEERKIYLGAAPQCPIPDYYLDTAIKTGLFDYIFVQFYNNAQCQYSSGNPTNLFNSWDDWTSRVLPNNSVYLGLPANPSAAGSGYIPPADLINTVLPYVKQASNYGGVMLWSRYWDIQTNPSYSDQISPYIGNSALQSIVAIKNAVFECVSSTLYRLFSKSGRGKSLLSM